MINTCEITQRLTRLVFSINVAADMIGGYSAGLETRLSPAPGRMIKECSENNRLTCPADTYTSGFRRSIQNIRRAWSAAEGRACEVYKILTLYGNLKLFLKRHWKRV